MTQWGTVAAIALGGNQGSPSGSPDRTLISAVLAIRCEVGNILAVSRLFRTPAHPPGAGPDFVNGAVLVQTSLDPEACLSALHGIEAGHARARKERWAARTLDLDLLMMADLVAPDAATQRRWAALPPDRQKSEAPERLILPHPRLQDRAFVLIPLAEIAPFWRHPLTGKTVADMAAALPEAEKAAISPL
ncbi:MAG: 2-amino-4-hydroxy-6-hydroxymethyldihydropteridine diphosphokinase [Paracoccaceae bacterium]